MTRSAAPPVRTLVVNRASGPNTVRALVAVTSLFVEAGIRVVVPFLLHTVAFDPASITAPVNDVPKRAVVTREPSALAMRLSAALGE